MLIFDTGSKATQNGSRIDTLLEAVFVPLRPILNLGACSSYLPETVLETRDFTLFIF